MTERSAGSTSRGATRSSRDGSNPGGDEAAPANEATQVGADSGPGSAPAGQRAESTRSAEKTSAPTTEGPPAPGSPGESGGIPLTGGRVEGPPKKQKIGMPRGSRRARLRLSRLDPWSVMKTAFLFSIAAGIILVVAVYVIWSVIGASGLLDSIDDIVGSVLKSPGDTAPFHIEQYVNTQKVMGVTALLACIDVVIITALTTLASFLYNLASTMVGGLEVTLAED